MQAGSKVPIIRSMAELLEVATADPLQWRLCMQYVDHELQLVNVEAEKLHLSHFSFICHSCEKTFAERSDELYYFIDEDFVYHRHDAEFFRAIMVMPNGALRISSLDSVEENVLQRYKLLIGPANTVVPAGAGSSALKECSRKFFESMKRQKRNIEVEKIHIRPG
jgi:hypothetical protein